jgi:hypothetical protein
VMLKMDFQACSACLYASDMRGVDSQSSPSAYILVDSQSSLDMEVRKFPRFTSLARQDQCNLVSYVQPRFCKSAFAERLSFRQIYYDGL